MIIYKITNNVNGKIYIGQTIRTLEERFAEHKRSKKSLISKALNKYGIENFTVEQIDAAKTIEELNELEFKYIKEYDCITPNGYNQCDGGGNTFGYHHSEKSKQKMSQNKKGKYTGAENHFYGKHHTEETRTKMKEAWTNRVVTDEQKQNLKASHYKRQVQNVDTGKIFDSVKEAAEYYGLKDTHISRVCKGKRNKTGGFRWKYVD